MHTTFRVRDFLFLIIDEIDEKPENLRHGIPDPSDDVSCRSALFCQLSEF